MGPEGGGGPGTGISGSWKLNFSGEGVKRSL